MSSLDATVRKAASIKRILEYLGHPTTLPPLPPPDFDDDIDQTPKYDPALAQRAPDYEFDQTIGW